MRTNPTISRPGVSTIEEKSTGRIDQIIGPALDVTFPPGNTTFLLFGQPSGDANTRGTLITKTEEVAINAKTANWKATVIFLILQATIK
uniref:Uncharacterized protein n=2 Tax=Aegilops tauschii subsp. strangulata TaxID=200361 RepID=A0A453EJU2_AEGTS